MKNKLNKILIILAISLFGIFNFSPVALPYINSVNAATTTDDVCDSKAPAEVKKAAGCRGNTDAVKDIITNILNAVIGISGLIAVVFVIIGGVQYMTSTGDTSKVEKAKKTIIYALIGLAVCALAFAIVNFTINIIYTKN